MCLADVVQFYNSSTEIISDKSIWHHRNSSNANGMYILEGIQIVKEVGCTTEAGYLTYSSWLNQPSDLHKPQDLEIPSIPTFILKEEYGVIHSASALRVALACLGPCLLSLPCHKRRGKFWVPETNTNLWLSERSETTTPQHHSVLVVGYKENGFIIRNSWGTSWGKNGYGFISDADFEKHQQLCVYFWSDSKAEKNFISKKMLKKKQ